MAPSKKVTEPEGTEPDEVTVAERVTELSASAGLGEAMRTVEVGWPAMTWLREAELATKTPVGT